MKKCLSSLAVSLLVVVLGFFAFTGRASAAASTDSLAGYWKFDATASSSVILDSSGDAFSLTASGTAGNNYFPQPTSTIPTTTFSFGNSRALDFDGTDDYLRATSTDALNSSTLSVAFWVKFRTVDNTHRTLVSKWQVGVLQQFTVQLDTDNTIGFWTGDGAAGSSDRLGTTNTFVPNTWYHIVATVNGADKALYVNGVSNNTDTAGVTMGTSSVDFTVGSKENSSGNYFEFFDGQMDDLRVYNRVLSPTEVAALAAGNYTAATWTGASSTSYETAGNWDINAVPDQFTNVTIADTANPAVLSATTSVQALTIDNGGVLSLNGNTLNVSSTFSNNGTFKLRGDETIAGLTQDTDSGTWQYVGDGNGNANFFTIKDFGTNDYYNLSVSSTDSADTFLMSDTTTALGAVTLTSGQLSADAHGLVGKYYSGTDLNTYVASYVDPKIDFNPGDTVLGTDRVGSADDFSIRWDGQVKADYSETYTFYAYSDDGVRLWVNGTEIINHWFTLFATEYSGTITLTAGQWYDIRLEYFENSGDSVIQLKYSSPSESKKIIPTGALRTNSTSTFFNLNVAGDWQKTNGSFTAGSSTVALTGANQTISGSNSFYNLTKTVAGPDTLTFASGTTQTVAATTTLQGGAGGRLSLRSSSAGAQWDIDPQGARSFSQLDVQDSNNVNATSVSLDSTSVNSGNNTNWQFTVASVPSHGGYSPPLASSSDTADAPPLDTPPVVTPPPAIITPSSTPSIEPPPDPVVPPVITPPVVVVPVVVSSSVSVPSEVSVPAFIFKENLKRGMVGSDVRELQKTLNALGFMVATSGPGSPGQETTFFGNGTYAAVVQLQEKNAEAILKPFGITKGTGLVYSLTRAYLNNRAR